MAKRGPKPKKTEYYIDPADFKNRLIDYYKSDGECPKELAEMLVKIAMGLSYSGNFCNYSYRDEMQGDALVKMYAAVKNKKFDVTSEYNPFSYFTTIAFHAFINRIKKEKKQHETLNEYRSRFYAEEMANSSDIDVYVKPDSDNSDDNDEQSSGE